VHDLALGASCRVYCKPDALFVFSPDGALLFAPVLTLVGA
jgi:glycerol transport system ATP-binding protein